MCTIVIEALTPLDRTSRIKIFKNDARSRLFCRIAKRSMPLANDHCLFQILFPQVLNLTNINDDIMYEIRVYVGSGISISGTKCEIQLHIYGTLDVLGPVDLPVTSLEEDGIASFLISTNKIIGDIGSIGIFCKAMDLRYNFFCPLF